MLHLYPGGKKTSGEKKSVSWAPEVLFEQEKREFLRKHDRNFESVLCVPDLKRMSDMKNESLKYFQLLIREKEKDVLFFLIRYAHMRTKAGHYKSVLQEHDETFRLLWESAPEAIRKAIDRLPTSFKTNLSDEAELLDSNQDKQNKRTSL